MNCPQCNAPLPADAPNGLCPACLLKRGLEPNTLPPSEIPNLNSPWTPPALVELAPFFPDLDLLSLLGRGGMGAVYKARQKSLDRIIALKILPPQISHDPSFSSRFAQEAQALAKLNHPHIVTIYDFGQRTGDGVAEAPAGGEGAQSARTGETGTLFFFLMEYIDGLSLRQLLNASRLAPNDALAIVPQICDALQYAHDRGIVHRDIKPENILLTKSGQIKIADFGLAKLITPNATPAVATKKESIAGTPEYMAPEQSAAPDFVDHRADIYALGVVFYQMLTGELPPSPLTPPSTKVHIDVRLDEIVLRALEKSPGLRYQSATQFKTEIETLITERPPPQTARTTVLPPPLPTLPDQAGIANSLRIPSIALRVIAAFNLLLCSWAVIGIPLILFGHGFEHLAGPDMIVACVVFMMFIANLFIFRAGQNMAKLRNYSQVLVGSIVSMLFAPLGLAVGIWSLILLMRTDIKAAFDSPISTPPPRGAVDAPLQPPGPSCLSRAALLGASWAPFALLAALFYITAQHEGGPGMTPTMLGYFCAYTLVPLGLTAPFATTLCGIISLSQIRRSNARLYGLPVALFDALLFPLIALDALIVAFWYYLCIALMPSPTHTFADIDSAGKCLAAITALSTLSILAVDYWLIRIAWRAAKSPQSGNAFPPHGRDDVPPQTPRLLKPSQLSRTALIGALWSPWFPIAFVLFFTAHHVDNSPGLPPPSPALSHTILIFLVGTLGLTAPFATTLCGLLSLSQIRRSNNRLYGLPLALFDTLFYPLLILDALIIYGLGIVAREQLMAAAPQPEVWLANFVSLYITCWLVFVLDSLLILFACRRAEIPTSRPPAPRSTVQAPAIALAVVGILNSVIALCICVFAATAPLKSWAQIVLFVSSFLLFISGVAIILAAIRMYRLRLHGVAVTASLLAILTSLLNPLAIPIVLWSLTVLTRREVRELFDPTLRTDEPFPSAAPPTRSHALVYLLIGGCALIPVALFFRMISIPGPQPQPGEQIPFKNLPRDVQMFSPTPSPPSTPDPFKPNIIPLSTSEQAAARIKLQYAEEDFQQAEAQRKIGRIAPPEYFRIKAARNIAAAELTGNPAEIARAKYDAAEEEFQYTDSLAAVGRMSPTELHKAKLARDLAAVATQPISSIAPSHPVIAARAYAADLPIHLNLTGLIGPAFSTTQPSIDPKDLCPVTFSVPETQAILLIKKFRDHQRVPVVVYSHNTGAALAWGALNTIGSQFDATTATLPCTASITPYPDTPLIPNEFVNVQLLLETRHNVTLIPPSALLVAPQSSYVYVIKADQTVEQQAVAIGDRSDDRVEIQSGLSPGDLVATDGADALHPGDKVQYPPLPPPPPAAARLELKAAEEILHDAEIREDVVSNGRTAYIRAKATRDIAAAEATGDPGEIARARYNAADEIFRDLLPRRYIDVTPIEYAQAKTNRDIAIAELTADPVQIAQAKYKAAEEVLQAAKPQHEFGIISGEQYRRLQLTRDLAAAATQPTR